MAEESSLKKGVMVMKGDLRVLAEQTVAWRQKVPPVRKERGVRVDIDAVAEHTESHARTKKTGVCVCLCVCVGVGGVCVCVGGGRDIPKEQRYTSKCQATGVSVSPFIVCLGFFGHSRR